MSKKTENPLSSLRPGYIELVDIAGVDIEAGTYTPHEDFPNPKTQLRDSILHSLSLATSPDQVEPILVFLHTDGKVVVLDGTHRLINAVNKCGGDPKSDWSKIRAVRFLGSVADAKIKSQVANLEVGRSNLTEAEEVGVVEYLIKIGLDIDTIIEKIGFGSPRWISKIMKVIEATPDVLAAVKAGELSLETGSKIADHVDVTKQAKAVEKAKKLEKTKGGVKARQDLGLRKERVKILKYKDIMNNIFLLYNDVQSDECDEETMGRWNAYMEVICIDQETFSSQIRTLEEAYKEWEEKN